MKTATIPSLRVDEELRTAAQEVLAEGESLSSFVVQSIRESIYRRQAVQAFIARGLHSRDEARVSNEYVTAQSVIAKLAKKLAAAKKSAKTRK